VTRFKKKIPITEKRRELYTDVRSGQIKTKNAGSLRGKGIGKRSRTWSQGEEKLSAGQSGDG